MWLSYFKLKRTKATVDDRINDNILNAKCNRKYKKNTPKQVTHTTFFV